MRLEWLEDILAIAETGSFSEAAERRGLTQSAFSRRVHQIEKFVGVALFDRSRKPVQLRATTVEQHEQIARLARMLVQLTQDLRRGDRTTGNRLIIAAQHALMSAWAPSFVKRVQGENSDIFLKLRSANLAECFAFLLSRQADIAVVYRYEGDLHPDAASITETVVIGKDRLIPIFACSHSKQLKEHFSRKELPIIVYPDDVYFGQVFDRVVRPRVSRPVRLRPVVEAALTIAAMELAVSGVGVAWVPASLARHRLERGEITDLSSQLPNCDLEVAAVRIAGRITRVENSVWDELIRFGIGKL